VLGQSYLNRDGKARIAEHHADASRPPAGPVDTDPRSARKMSKPAPSGYKTRTVASGGYPRRFGSYVLLKPLARGGMGELDLAVTGGRGMEKLCVIKRVLPHLLASDSVQRFREEAMVVVRLSHGNLVGVLDAGREE
jgi:serine/threonine protein kinase